MAECENADGIVILKRKINGLLDNMDRYKASEGVKDSILKPAEDSEERKVPNHDGKETVFAARAEKSREGLLAPPRRVYASGATSLTEDTRAASVSSAMVDDNGGAANIGCAACDDSAESKSARGRAASVGSATISGIAARDGGAVCDGRAACDGGAACDGRAACNSRVACDSDAACDDRAACDGGAVTPV